MKLTNVLQLGTKPPENPCYFCCVRDFFFSIFTLQYCWTGYVGWGPPLMKSRTASLPSMVEAINGGYIYFCLWKCCYVLVSPVNESPAKIDQPTKPFHATPSRRRYHFLPGWWKTMLFGEAISLEKKKEEEQETLVIRVTPQLLVVLVFSSHAWTAEHLSGSGQPQMTKNPSLTPFELDRLITIFLGLKSVILLRHAPQCVSWVSRGQSNISHRLLMHALRTSKSLTGALSMHQILYTKHHNQWQALSSSLIVQPLITHYKLHAPRGICHINIHEVSWHGQYL